MAAVSRGKVSLFVGISDAVKVGRVPRQRPLLDSGSDRRCSHAGPAPGLVKTGEFLRTCELTTNVGIICLKWNIEIAW